MKPGGSLDVGWLERRMPGRALHYFESIGSTMTEAARLAAAGEPAGAVVVAGEQTAGKGRAGHGWHSEPASGLYLTLLLRPPKMGDQLPLLTLAAGLAVKEAVEAVAGVTADLRWPNDLLIGDKKAAGILLTCEAGAVLCGTGINVNHTRFPEDIAAIATSLRLAGRREFAREPLLVRVVEGVERHVRLLIEEGPAAILDAFAHASSYVRGRRVRVDFGDQVQEGVTEGLDERGFLRLRTEAGRLVTILAGGVRPV